MFDDEYFKKHRDPSEWSNYEKRGISGLNIKNKPKPQEITQLSQIEAHDDFEDEVVEITNSSDSWRAEYRKTLTAGFAGGFIVLLIMQMKFLEKSIVTVDFWVSSVVIVFIIIAFVFLFEMPFRVANK